MFITAAELREKISGKNILWVVEGGETAVFKEGSVRIPHGYLGLLVQGEHAPVSLIVFGASQAPILVGLDRGRTDPSPMAIQVIPDLHPVMKFPV